MRKAAFKSVAVSLAFVLCAALLVLAGSNNGKGTEKAAVDPNQKSAINCMDGKILLVVPDDPFTSELAMARSIKTSYHGKEEIAVASESELNVKDKKTANLILILRLNRSEFYERAFQNFNTTAGKGFIQVADNPWDSEKHMILLVGFDDKGLKAVHAVFQKMSIIQLRSTAIKARMIETKKIQIRSQGELKEIYKKMSRELKAAIESKYGKLPNMNDLEHTQDTQRFAIMIFAHDQKALFRIQQVVEKMTSAYEIHTGEISKFVSARVSFYQLLEIAKLRCVKAMWYDAMIELENRNSR